MKALYKHLAIEILVLVILTLSISGFILQIYRLDEGASDWSSLSLGGTGQLLVEGDLPIEMPIDISYRAENSGQELELTFFTENIKLPISVRDLEAYFHDRKDGQPRQKRVAVHATGLLLVKQEVEGGIKGRPSGLEAILDILSMKELEASYLLRMTPYGEFESVVFSYAQEGIELTIDLFVEKP